MNAKYAVVLAALGGAQIGLAFSVGWFGFVLFWSGISWILAGCAYAGLGSGILGKRTDGNVAWQNRLLMLPYLAVTYGLWWTQRLLSREASCHEIAPGLWLGRRCSGKKLAREIQFVVDVTAEFIEPKRVRTNRDYLCVPTLDASIPSLSAFDASVRAVAESLAARKPVYVHCAKGYGRSAMLVTAALVASGNAQNIDEAEQVTRRVRPGVKINSIQRQLLRDWQKQRG